MAEVQKWLSNPTVVQVIEAAIGLLLVYAAVRIARRLLGPRFDDPAARYHFRKLVTLGGYLVALLLLLMVFRTRLSGATVFLGVAAAGITVALREVILSIAGWLAISVGHLYSAGDRIEIAGVKGDVIDISILRTTVMEIGQWVNSDLYTGRIVRIANSFVYQQPVFNFSGDFPYLWDEFTVPVRYGSDRLLAREIIQRAADEVVADYTRGAHEHWQRMLRKYRVEEARIQPMVTLVANSNWIEYTVRYVVDYRKRRITKDLIFSRILDEFDRTDGRVRTASETQEIVGFPDLSVRLHDEKPRPSE